MLFLSVKTINNQIKLFNCCRAGRL